MLRIGICDNESGARDALRLALERLLRADDEKIFYEFSSGEGVLGWLAKHAGELDLLFLDVELGGISGMEAARKIRDTDAGLMLVFVTGYADFVFDGYAVGALGYLVKPVREEKLREIADRAKRQLESRAPQNFVVKNSDGMYRIAKQDILYVQSDRRLVKVVTKNRTYSYYGKLNDAQTALGAGFVRIHQRYLVQAGAVSKIEAGRIAVGNAVLPVSRSLRERALLELARNMVGGEEQP